MTNQFEQHVITKMAALGRQFQLGDLYNYQTDCIMKGGRCWESSNLASATLVDSNFKLKLIRAESESKKWDHIGLDDHSKASTVAGLIDKYHGASAYLNDRKNTAQITQTIVCRIKSKREQLELAKLTNQDNQDVQSTGQKGEKENNLKDATHVIVGVVYGAEAYCILTRDLADETDQDAKEDAKDNLTGWADKLESALEENQNVTEFKEQFDQEERKTLTRMKCRLYTDVLTPTLHECNYFDAYKICSKLIEQIKKGNAKRMKSVPIFLKLCPLNMITNPTGTIAIKSFEFRDVDANLIARCCQVWDELEYMHAKAKEAFKSAAKLNSKSLSEFINLTSKYLELVRKSLKECVIKARSVDGTDDAMEKIIKVIEEHSIFKPSQLEQWLRYKTAEAEMAKELANLNEITFLATSIQLKKELSDSFDKKYSFVLHIPALNEKTNQVLKAMTDYFETYTKLVFIKDEADDEGDDILPWHMVQRKQKKILEIVQEFSSYVRRNKSIEKQVQFLMTLSEIGQKFGCHYSIYESDNLLKDINHLPIPPTDLQIRVLPNKKQLSYRLEWNYEDLGYPHNFLIEYRSKGSSDTWNQQKTTKPGQHSIILNCNQDSVLEFRVAVDTCVGRSEFSDLIDTESAFEDNSLEELNETISSTMFEPYQTHSNSRLSTASQKASLEESFQVKNNISNINLKPVLQPPTDVEVELVTQTTAELGWSSSSKSSLTYRVRYCPISQDLLSSKEINVGSETGCRLEQLDTETTYTVYVLAVSDDGRMSDPSEVVQLTTLNNQVRFAETILKRCTKNGSRNGMDLYTVPLTKSNKSLTADRFFFGKGEKPNGQVQHRTILVMGSTGAGKTTLINGMINYIFGVEWEDTFRFQLIQEQVAGRSQIDSQTSRITAYDIHHTEGFRVPYSLTIVDTPGYGDTKGLDRDQEITEMVRKFFEDKEGIQELDVVGFVAQASLPRLTPTQIYIFDSVLSIFGKDIKENINFLLTFADSQVPPVLHAIKEAGLPYPTDPDGDPLHHKFNNSGFFCSSRGESNSGAVGTVEKFNRFFWRMGMENFQRFFLSLATMKTKSLSLTKEVLDERKKLEATIDGLQPLIKVGLVKMDELRKTQQMITNSQAQIEANENVEFEVELTVPIKKDIPKGQYLTNCNKCYLTCHNPCGIPNDDGKADCWAMESHMPKATRSCRICPQKCIWNLHVNQSYCWEYVTKKHKTSSDIIKRQYETECNRKLTAQELIALLQKDVDEYNEEVLELVDTVAKSIQRLDEIALRPNPFSTPEYIDLIMEAEKQEKRTGFQERIQSLIKLREMAIIISKVRNNETFTQK